MGFWRSSEHEPTSVEPLQAATATESEMDGPSHRSIQRRKSGFVAVGLIFLGVWCLARRNEGPDARPVGSGHIDGVVVLNHKSQTKKCAWGLQNCNETKCCNNPGMQCFEQSQWYAQCRDTCTPGPDPSHWDPQPWTCKELGDRKEGDGKCSDLGEDCRKTKCCSTVNTQCFEKNEDWATCKSECTEGFPDLSDADNKPWSCKQLGEWKKGAADWVQQKCSMGTDDCTDTHCCAEPGKQCYQQQDYFAQCKYTCPENDWESEWSCKEVGGRTPGVGGAPPGKLGKWATDTCVGDNTDCRDAKCCLNMDTQCYEKNKDWAMCMNSCTKGIHPEDGNESWSCKELGPRSVAGLAIKGSPSLFCWSLFMTTSYEMEIIQNQLKQNSGIFQCDDYALLSTDDETDMGETKDGKKIKTIHIEKAEITRTVDGTAGNAKLFMNCWEAIVTDGRWRQYAWMIKVDPDAVIIPERVRDHLKEKVMENVYVVNCNAFPDSPNFPMMYGSVEIYSFKAMETYAQKWKQCLADMGSMLGMWGEDYYMTHCLDHIGVGRISDFVSVGDNVCSGGSCGDQAFSAFHPYKSVQAWQDCWDYAHGKAPPQQTWA